MQYPESLMNVAVAFGNNVVKTYGHEKDGFRPFLSEQKFDEKPAAMNYVMKYNAKSRKSIGL